MTFGSKALEMMVESIATTIKAVVDGPNVGGRLAALEARIEGLEASHADLELKALKGGAPWQRGTGYAVNDIVQHGRQSVEMR